MIRKCADTEGRVRTSRTVLCLFSSVCFIFVKDIFTKPKLQFMNPAFKILFLLGLSVLLTSAVCIEKPSSPLASAQIAGISNSGTIHSTKTRKLNFFQRLALRLLMKKYKSANGVNADKLASTSLLLGILSCGTLLLGLFVPFVILLSIPTGIAAMITGGSAVRNKTSQMGKAKTGKALGLGALIAFGLLLIIAAIVISSVGLI